MMTTTTEKPPISFWIIAIIATLWNAMGIKQYLQHAYQTEAFKAMYTDENLLNMVLNTPKWVMAAFAIAVLFGFLGSILLLLRKQWASPLYLISLIGIIVHMFYNVFLSKALEFYGTGYVVMPLMVVIVGVFLYFYSKRASANVWVS